MKRTLVIPMLAVGLLTAACSNKTDEAAKEAEATAKAAQTMASAEIAPSAANANKPGVAVAAKTLASFLGTPSGYALEGTPETMEMAVQGQKYSSAQGKFKSGDKEINVSIFDYNYIAGMTAAYSAMMNMSLETNEESLHSDKIGGFPAWIEWKKTNNEGTIGIVVNDRIFVVITGSNGATLEDLKAAANAVNLSGIASSTKS
jgi:hypothetical protein